MAHPSTASLPLRLVPILGRIPGYRREWLMADVLAGFALDAECAGVSRRPGS